MARPSDRETCVLGLICKQEKAQPFVAFRYPPYTAWEYAGAQTLYCRFRFTSTLVRGVPSRGPDRRVPLLGRHPSLASRRHLQQDALPTRTRLDLPPSSQYDLASDWHGSSHQLASDPV